MLLCKNVMCIRTSVFEQDAQRSLCCHLFTVTVNETHNAYSIHCHFASTFNFATLGNFDVRICLFFHFTSAVQVKPDIACDDMIRGALISGNV
jgi:hypothetical protein